MQSVAGWARSPPGRWAISNPVESFVSQTSRRATETSILGRGASWTVTKIARRRTRLESPSSEIEIGASVLARIEPRRPRIVSVVRRRRRGIERIVARLEERPTILSGFDALLETRAARLERIEPRTEVRGRILSIFARRLRRQAGRLSICDARPQRSGRLLETGRGRRDVRDGPLEVGARSLEVRDARLERRVHLLGARRRSPLARSIAIVPTHLTVQLGFRGLRNASRLTSAAARGSSARSTARAARCCRHWTLSCPCRRATRRSPAPPSSATCTGTAGS